MQLLFTILIAITIGVLAKKRGWKPLEWVIYAIILFLVIDTGILFLMVKVFPDLLNSDAGFTYAAIAEKIVVFSALVAAFHVYLKGATSK